MWNYNHSWRPFKVCIFWKTQTKDENMTHLAEPSVLLLWQTTDGLSGFIMTGAMFLRKLPHAGPSVQLFSLKGVALLNKNSTCFNQCIPDHPFFQKIIALTVVSFIPLSLHAGTLISKVLLQRLRNQNILSLYKKECLISFLRAFCFNVSTCLSLPIFNLL